MTNPTFTENRWSGGFLVSEANNTRARDQVTLAQRGWDAVPAYRHPEMMPTGYKGATIDREGQRLMERPLEITNESKARELRKARSQVQQKEAQIKGAPAGDNSPFDTTNKGAPLNNIRRSYEAMPIPK